MEPNGASNAVPSAGDLILQQKTQAVQNAQQAAQNGDGSLFSQLTNNPLFTAVCLLQLALN
jgi:chaperone BCS1